MNREIAFMSLSEANAEIVQVENENERSSSKPYVPNEFFGMLKKALINKNAV